MQVVLLSAQQPSPLLARLLGKRWARHSVTFLVGSPLLRKDLLRAGAGQADMLFVLADLAAADPAGEDEETVLMAAAMHRAYPKIPLRVLLVRRDARRLAITAGLPRANCVAAHELGPRLLSLAARCGGAPALLCNLSRCKTAAMRRGIGSAGGGAFDEEYVRGAGRSVHGALVGASFPGCGLTFHEAAQLLFDRHEARCVSGVLCLI